jgi:streptogramin lyase
VAKVSTSGSFTEYTVPTAISILNGITAGPDGNVWFTEFHAGNVAKIVTGARSGVSQSSATTPAPRHPTAHSAPSTPGPRAPATRSFVHGAPPISAAMPSRRTQVTSGVLGAIWSPDMWIRFLFALLASLTS